ncbi:MAG: serine/threonine protein kinase [Proteobacteria bacterium]|nr:serine/threonine protein kinase [Pseudomonadota bacterium]
MTDTTQTLQTPQQLMLKYRYERLLGEGSNGKTYLATDLNSGKYVAIKALKLNLNDSFKSFELFKREAETLSSLNVQGVPKFYESILSDKLGGECYIVQEYINAPSILSTISKGRKFSEAETLTIMQKIAEILHILHTQYTPPIIHRDIKPSNILCNLPKTDDCADWQAMRLYLIDFGAVANARSNTDKSTIAGTIGYMAPEQIFGECLPQTDIYALGATALHMLTGDAPYDMDFDTFSINHSKALDTYAPKTSKGMRDLLARMLHYASDKRPASASELLGMIENVRAGKMPAASEHQSLLARIRQFLIKHFKRIEFRRSVFYFEKKNADHIRYAFGTIQAIHELPIPPNTWFKDRVSLPRSMPTVMHALEYTFEADGVTWCGLEREPIHALTNTYSPQAMTRLPKGPNELQLWLQQEVPCPTISSGILQKKCLVQYKDNDPSYCTLAYVLY